MPEAVIKGEKNKAGFYIEEERIGGKITRHSPTYPKITNEGKSNERNCLKQGLVIARPLYLKKLEKAEVISGSQIILNPKILGFKTMAFIGIYLDKAIRNPEAVKQLEQIDEVIECHYTTGNWSIFVKLLCRDNEHLMELLNKKIQSVEGVSRTETFISLQQQLNRQISI